MDIDLLRVIADWTGWAPIAIVLFVVVFGVIFVYSREVSNKDETIRRLSIELENSKQYTPSLLIQNLGQHVKEYEQEIGRLNERLRILNDEVETETRKKSVIEQEKNNVLSELEIARSDILKLKDQLKSYEEDLDDLIEDYCEICDPDEDHIWANFINWGNAMCEITGDESLLSKIGYCNYCTSPQIKCGNCGSINSINLEVDRQTECAGGCGVIFTIDSFVEDKSLQYSINVSREEEADE